jgi:hypothetical protein
MTDIADAKATRQWPDGFAVAAGRSTFTLVVLTQQWYLFSRFLGRG